MPKRLDPNDIIKHLADYGHSLVMSPQTFIRNYRNQRQSFQIRDNVTNRVYSTTLNNFNLRIRRGQISKTDPFLHALQLNDTFNTNANTREDKQLSKFAQTQTSHFTEESKDIQTSALDKAKEFKRQAMLADDLTIVHTYDDTQDKINLYAFINTLYTIVKSKLPQRYKIVIEIVWNDIPSYYYINDNTISMLNKLISNIYFGERLEQLTDSSTAALFSLQAWDYMSIRFYSRAQQRARQILGNTDNTNTNNTNPLDTPKLKNHKTRNFGSFWHYLNTTNIDLSRYGIFNEFKQDNYNYPCFVYALQQSKQFTQEEIELINDSINTVAFPCDCIKHICELFDIHISLAKHDSTHNKILATKQYGSKTASHNIKLLLRDNHYKLVCKNRVCTCITDYRQ